MSPSCHTSEDVKEPSSSDLEVYNHFRARSTSVNDFGQPFGSCDTKQNSSAGVPDPTLPLAPAYTSSVLDALGTGTNNLRIAMHAAADSSSRSGSRTALTAFVRRTTKLGPIVDASALVPRTEPSEKEPMGEATGGSEAAVIIRRSKGVDTQGDKYPATQTTHGAVPRSRFMKPQAGNRSRFRPWGYI